MVKPVDRIVPDFAKAGASIISFHPEASEHVDRTIGLIHDSGCKAGLVFNPATPLSCLDHVLDKLDLVLIMSVNPGLRRPVVHSRGAGQARARARAHRCSRSRARAARSGSRSTAASRSTTSRAIAKAGADTFVAGSAIFGTKDYRATIAAMRAAVAALAGASPRRWYSFPSVAISAPVTNAGIRSMSFDASQPQRLGMVARQRLALAAPRVSSRPRRAHQRRSDPLRTLKDRLEHHDRSRIPRARRARV